MKTCPACNEAYEGRHWCLVISNNPELARRLDELKARRARVGEAQQGSGDRKDRQNDIPC